MATAQRTAVQTFVGSTQDCELAAIKKAKHVLIVDDSPFKRKAMRCIVDRAEYSCDLAATGTKAISLASMWDYDLIIMDLRMPDLDGFTTAKELRLAGCSAQIAAFSAYPMPTDIELCRAAGIDTFILRPLTPQLLRHLCQETVE